MNDQLARSLFMEYLYDEISEEKKLELETYLAKNPDLAQELNKFKQTRTLLQHIPETDPNHQLMVVEARKYSLLEWWQEAKNLLPESFLGKSAFAAVAGFILLLIIGSASQLHLETSGDGVAVSMGYSPTINQGITNQQAEALLNQIREENAALLADYAEAINQQNDQQLQKVITYLQKQRMTDLQLVDQTLNELQQNTYYRLNQTNQYLDEVLETVSYQNDN